MARVGELRKNEDERRTSLSMRADKSAGRVRLPIDRAMDLVIQRGLPVRAAGAPAGVGKPLTGREHQSGTDGGITSFYPTGAGGAKDNVKK